MRIIWVVNSRDIIAKLKADGWALVHTRGSHHHFKHPAKSGRVTVPHPKRDLPIGTVRSIYRQAGWSWSEKK
jgi:predicted RNA binding protein YcfA (HicA-like mRNA interferase family)